MSPLFKAWMIYLGLVFITPLSYIVLIYWGGPIILKIPLYIIAGYGTLLMVSIIAEHVLRWLNCIFKK